MAGLPNVSKPAETLEPSGHQTLPDRRLLRRLTAPWRSSVPLTVAAHAGGQARAQEKETIQVIGTHAPF